MVGGMSSRSAPRICMPRLSRLARQVFRTGLYEAQDVLAECDDVDVIQLEPSKAFGLGQTALRRLVYHDLSGKLASLNPGLRPVRLTRPYELFLMHCNFVEDVWYANAIQGWRDHCRTSVCWIDELWIPSLPRLRRWLPVLERFDHVIVGYPGTGQVLGEAIGRRCHEILPAVDAIRFSPFPTPPPRVIDVYSVGRRWEAIHRRLRQSAPPQLFYVYGTLDRHAESTTIDPRDHRDLYANQAKRSRFYVVAPAKMNAPDETRGQVAIGYRYFEGAAAGAVLIGQAPDSEVFRQQFDWPEAVIDIRRDGSDVLEVIARLTAERDRLRAISCRNTEQVLRRHDWAYRWKDVLALAGLEPGSRMAAREMRLAELAALAGEHAAVARPA
jgi:glycosyl transferase family 1